MMPHHLVTVLYTASKILLTLQCHQGHLDLQLQSLPKQGDSES